MPTLLTIVTADDVIDQVNRPGDTQQQTAANRVSVDDRVIKARRAARQGRKIVQGLTKKEIVK